MQPTSSTKTHSADQTLRSTMLNTDIKDKEAMQKENILINIRNGAMVCNLRNLQGLRCGKIYYYKKRMMRHQTHLHMDEEMWQDDEQHVTEPSKLLVRTS